MRKSIVWAALAFALTASSFAQDFTKAEVFGGYQYTRINPGSGVDGDNFNGWNAAVQYNWSKAFGLKADFSGAYKSVNTLAGDVSLRQHHFLFGPVFSARTEKSTFFVHALFGGAHATADTGTSLFGSASDTAFAMAFGGGYDYNLNKNFGIRLGQFDYLPTRFGGETQNNFRYSTGVVLRF
jgi:opacity protein-like surface antigen